VPLQGSQFWFKGAAVELALAEEAREVWAQVRLGKPVEVSLAADCADWARMAKVRTSASVSAGGRPTRCKGRGWCRFHHSSTTTYRETRRVSRSMCRPSVRVVEAAVVRCGFGRICSRAGRRLGAGSRVASRHDPEHGEAWRQPLKPHERRILVVVERGMSKTEIARRYDAS
jgi:hypothetical protein